MKINEKTGMDGKEKITLIMPVHHEGDAVIPVVATLFLSTEYPFKLIVVYDSEDDETVNTIKYLQQFFNNIYLVQNKWREGALNAVKTGFDHADTPYVGIWVSYHVDAFGIINKIIEKIEEGYDLVSATRFRMDIFLQRGQKIKKLLSYFGNNILNRIIGMPISDVTTSLKVFRKSMLDEISIETNSSGGWAFCMELAIKAAIKGYRIAELPLERKNVNLLHGMTNFKPLKQLPEYLRWLFLGWKNRKLIRKNCIHLSQSD